MDQDKGGSTNATNGNGDLTNKYRDCTPKHWDHLRVLVASDPWRGYITNNWDIICTYP